MVVVPSTKQTSSSSSPLSMAPQNEKESSKGSLSFSELLRGASSQKDEKTLQNGAVVLKLSDKSEDTKTPKASSSDNSQSLLSLLKNGEIANEKSEKSPLILNNEITQKMTPAELKVLINEAKQYLKDKISASEGFKKSDIEALPKTLKGLVQVAQKLGIDVSKITLEEVNKSVNIASKKALLSESADQKDADSKNISKEKVSSESLSEEKNLRNKPTNDAAAENSTKLKTPSELAVDKSKKNHKTEQNASTQTAQQVVNEEQKAETKTQQIKPQETPLFKAQTKTEISTQEIVNAKSTVIELRKPKEKAEDTLKLLLRTDKSSKSESGLTADFSVATARVIVSQKETPAMRGLETLLHGQKEEGAFQGKLDGLNVAKADSFEVKINEAKQMVKYLSQDVKTAIEDYKSPFTRVKVQLNPQRLGEVDLTVVQRGKNLHVTLSSNNAAINTLAMNANDLRVQLTNNGIQNATLNFSSNPQSQDGSAGQQQQSSQQQRQQANEEYNYFESEEANEEILSSLEIVVPSYA